MNNRLENILEGLDLLASVATVLDRLNAYGIRAQMVLSNDGGLVNALLTEAQEKGERAVVAWVNESDERIYFYGTGGKAVTEIVLETARDAGLEPEWTGSLDHAVTVDLSEFEL